MTSKGAWMDGQQIIRSLRGINPPLKRSAILRANSGRYSTSMVVNGNLVTTNNPTGMIIPLGKKLNLITWCKLKEKNLCDARTSGGNVLTTVLVLRQGDPRGCIFEGISAIVNMELSNTNSQLNLSSNLPSNLQLKSELNSTNNTNQDNSGNEKMKIFRLDVGEDSTILNELGIKELPTFLMYEKGRLLYAGPIGGRKIKMSGAVSKPQILIIEPDFKHQLLIEKTLKKLNCDSFICPTVIEAVDRINQMNSVIIRTDVKGGINEINIDIVLISSDLCNNDYSILCKRLGPSLTSKRTVLCGLVNVLGEYGRANLDSVKWLEDYSTTDVQNVLDPSLASIVQIAIQKPVKQISINKILNMRTLPGSDSCYGLTPESLLSKMKSIHAQGPGGNGPSLLSSTIDRGPVGGAIGLPYVGIKLSAEDVVLRGQNLLR